MQRVCLEFLYIFLTSVLWYLLGPVSRGHYFEVETEHSIKCKFYSDIKAESHSFIKLK